MASLKTGSGPDWQLSTFDKGISGAQMFLIMDVPQE
jgi:hypothetical protein